MKRTRLAARTLAAATLLVLGACGSSGSDDTEVADPTTSTSAATTPAPTASATTPTPSPTPTEPKPTITTKAPATVDPPRSSGTFIDYEVVSDDGVLIASPADTAKLVGSPTSLKTYMGALITRQATAGNDGCAAPPQISVTQVDTGGWARGGYFTPGCGGSAALWAKSGGRWTQAWSGQSLVDCATLERYAFPSRLAGNSCDSGSGTTTYRH